MGKGGAAGDLAEHAAAEHGDRSEWEAEIMRGAAFAGNFDLLEWARRQQSPPYTWSDRMFSTAARGVWPTQTTNFLKWLKCPPDLGQ
eukprot:scaffold34582_cov28-Tisochrysis_lutea.AAC.1